MQTNRPHRPRVLLVDDQEIVRAGLRVLLRRAGIGIAGEARTAAEAVAKAARLKPDVVLLDVRLPDGSGISACRDIRAARPDTKILFLTAFEDEGAMLASVSASAAGYLLKKIDGEKLVHAIRTVASGLSVLDPLASQPALERLRAQVAAQRQPPDDDRLSAQERRVLALVAEGKTNKQIGAVLGLSPKTVKNYLSRTFQKLQFTRRSQAVAWLLRDKAR